MLVKVCQGFSLVSLLRSLRTKTKQAKWGVLVAAKVAKEWGQHRAKMSVLPVAPESQGREVVES